MDYSDFSSLVFEQWQSRRIVLAAKRERNATGKTLRKYTNRTHTSIAARTLARESLKPETQIQELGKVVRAFGAFGDFAER